MERRYFYRVRTIAKYDVVYLIIVTKPFLLMRLPL